MKKTLFFLLYFCPLLLSAQQILDIGLYNVPVNGNKLEVRVKPTQTVADGAFTAGVFTIRFLSGYGVTLSAPAALNNPLFLFDLANQGTDGTYSYYSFSFVNPFTINWTVGTEYPIAVIQINAGCGSGSGIFEIINNAWTADNNGDVYLELGGNEAQNIIYQATANAPLGMGMLDIIPPTLTCPSNQTFPADLNRCNYTQNNTSLNAMGNDNCPGYIIRYTLSGATVDTLFTLDDAVFEKGLTILNVINTDGAGLTATCAFTVTVNDTQIPVITAPANLNVPANAMPCTATGLVLGVPVSSDNCPGAQVSNNAPANFPLGATTVVWIITDAGGLTATATQIVTVQSGLTASTLNLATHQLCSPDTTVLSFGISGGVGPYTVVYSENGTNRTLSNYANNQNIKVSPVVNTTYKWISVTDQIGCSVTPNNLVDSLKVNPAPSLFSLLPSEAESCLGQSVSFTANGLIPNASTTFQYTLTPGLPFAVTGISTVTGTYTFSGQIQLPGVYGMSIQSITVNGCTRNFSNGNSGTYIVHAFPTLGSIMPSEAVACSGSAVQIVANGLPPDVNVLFQYTINGVPGTETVLTASTGTASILNSTYPEGTYVVAINAVSVGGCSIVALDTTQFTVDPFQSNCGFKVGGKVKLKIGGGVEEAKVTLSGLGQSIPFSFVDITDTSGIYQYNNTLPVGSSYTITPYKNDNPLNGVTTFDLVLISKHILGVTPLNNPYNMIAADANKSGSITTFDIVEFRKLILGIYQNLPQNTSWRFVEEAYVFPDSSNPFVALFPETIQEQNLQMNAFSEDFVAIKVGDVNNTVVNLRSVPVERSAREMLWFRVSAPAGMQMPEKVRAGEIFTLLFTPSEQVLGYQFTLDLKSLEVLDLASDAGMAAESFGVFNDAVTTSFTASQAKLSGAFQIRFRVKSNGFLSEMLDISSRITLAEAYREGIPMEQLDVKLQLETPAAGRQFELYQNQPNPFAQNTLIPFYLPEADVVKLTVYDELGTRIFAQENSFESGQHTFQLDGSVLSGTGMLFYQVESGSGAAVKKMFRH